LCDAISNDLCESIMNGEQELRRRLGRMFLVGFDGLTSDDNPALLRLLEQDQPGGLLLFDRDLAKNRRNVADPAQVQALCAGLRARSPQPLLIAVDQEGGRVCRLKEADGFPATVSAAALGADDDPAATGRAAETMAADLAQLGINWNLTPVVDLAANPDNPVIARLGRAFGADPAQVTRHAAAVIKAHHRHGVACCLKHFPGHGSSTNDSHLGCVDVTASWHEDELRPFRDLIAAGLADAVMSAHIFHRRLDPALPATLSPAMLNGLLRRDLGYQGVIVSDDLQMRAISDRWSLAEAVGLAVQAGADMLIIGNQLAREAETVRLGVEAILALLRQGLVTEARLHASLERIDLLCKITGGFFP